MCRQLLSIILLFAVFVTESCENEPPIDVPIPQKMIISSDMVESFDDGIAMMMAFASPKVEVLGVITVTGNTWSQEGLAYAIRMGEIAGADNVSFIGGAQYPLRPGRLNTLIDEVNANPGFDSEWKGAVAFPEISDWKIHYESVYGQSPYLVPSNESAEDFMARQINSYPGQVSILSIGPCTNIAKALIQHPEIAWKAKEIMYMGGAVFCEGNTTPYAELNFLYDPEAAAICLESPFQKQTLVSLDVCNTVTIDSLKYFAIYDNLKSEKMKEVMRNQYYFDTFISKPNETMLVWDLISAALLIDPEICTEFRNETVEVDDNPSSQTYGKTSVTEEKSGQTVKIPLKIDVDKFWTMINNLMQKY